MGVSAFQTERWAEHDSDPNETTLRQVHPPKEPSLHRTKPKWNPAGSGQLRQSLRNDVRRRPCRAPPAVEVVNRYGVVSRRHHPLLSATTGDVRPESSVDVIGPRELKPTTVDRGKGFTLEISPWRSAQEQQD